MIKPFLRYAGSKRGLLPTLLPLVPKEFKTYHEVFLGGGSLFFALRPTKSILSDSNEELIRTFRIVRSSPNELIDSLRWAAQNHSKDFYTIMRDQSPKFGVPLATRFIYLNKTCYNGLYRVNKKGMFNVSLDPSKKSSNVTSSDYEDRILKASKALQGTDLKVSDFEASMTYCKTGDFAFLDSPYVPLTSTSNFVFYTKDGFSIADHERLAKCVTEINSRGVKFMMTNSDCQIVRSLYKGFDMKQIEAKRNINSVASKRGPVSELVITNY